MRWKYEGLRVKEKEKKVLQIGTFFHLLWVRPERYTLRVAFSSGMESPNVTPYFSASAISLIRRTVSSNNTFSTR